MLLRNRCHMFLPALLPWNIESSRAIILLNQIAVVMAYQRQNETHKDEHTHPHTYLSENISQKVKKNL